MTFAESLDNKSIRLDSIYWKARNLQFSMEKVEAHKMHEEGVQITENQTHETFNESSRR